MAVWWDGCHENSFKLMGLKRTFCRCAALYIKLTLMAGVARPFIISVIILFAHKNDKNQWRRHTRYVSCVRTPVGKIHNFCAWFLSY